MYTRILVAGYHLGGDQRCDIKDLTPSAFCLTASVWFVYVISVRRYATEEICHNKMRSKQHFRRLSPLIFVVPCQNRASHSSPMPSALRENISWLISGHMIQYGALCHWLSGWFQRGKNALETTFRRFVRESSCTCFLRENSNEPRIPVG